MVFYARMLNDVFFRRYENTPLRNSFEARDSRLLTQAFGILSDELYPYYSDGKESPTAVTFWENLHNSLARELGVRELSPFWSSYTSKWNGDDRVNAIKNTFVNVCETWMNQPVSGCPDAHLKERLSLIELGFRSYGKTIATRNASDPSTAELLMASFTKGEGTHDSRVREQRETVTIAFRSNVEELNTRFRQAGYPLDYHNGFIQFTTNDLVQQTVERPFWGLVAEPRWRNVDTDMKEAHDRRDSDGTDPAFYAARSLESTIKIISDAKGWTHGKENGAHNYIENLASKKNAFISPWEGVSLKEFFTHVRNPFGHGAGSDEMPRLERPQVEWAIEFSMSWIKNLIRRL